MRRPTLRKKKIPHQSPYPGYLRKIPPPSSSITHKKKTPSAPKRTYILPLSIVSSITLIWLIWFFSVPPFPYYRIKPGDTPYSLSKKFLVSRERINEINLLSPDQRLPPGQVIIVPQNATLGRTHLVRKKMETLSDISHLYDVPQWDLMRFNDLSSPILPKGTIVHLTQTRPPDYLVQQSDTLASVASQFSLSEDQLVEYNALNSDRIEPGQYLLLYSNQMVDFHSLPVQTIAKKIQKNIVAETSSKIVSLAQQTWATLSAVQKKQPTTAPETLLTMQSPIQKPPITDPSRFEPFVDPQLTYQENVRRSVHEDFFLASNLLEVFNHEILAMPILGRELEGYAIMIDPGHGGQDPGAVVRINTDKKAQYLVEDEFNYDISLRLYRLLKRHGAHVALSIISPNNLIREESELQFFENEKNEVYNDPHINFRPIGGRTGIAERVKIGKEFFGSTPAEKRLWISIHHDSSPHSPKGLVAVHNRATTETYALANSIINAQKRGKIIKDEYFVLTNNPSPAALLLEVRNPAIGEAKEMISAEQREKDTQMIYEGILAYVQAKIPPLTNSTP
ncbi:MAG: LysM peptidoglycan-binding domain-containing protein [Spirochaetia bacterium]